MDKCLDSSHDGNGKPGSGIIFPAAEKLLNAVSVLMDVCDDTGADRRGALALVTRRENELISAVAKHDAKVTALRAEVAALKRKTEFEQFALIDPYGNLHSIYECASWADSALCAFGKRDIEPELDDDEAMMAARMAGWRVQPCVVTLKGVR